MLYDRLYHALNLSSLPKPEFPFQRVDVQTPRDQGAKIDLTPQKPQVAFPPVSLAATVPSKPTGPQPVPLAQPGAMAYAPLGTQQPMNSYYTPAVTGPQAISYPRTAPPTTEHAAPVTHPFGNLNPMGVPSAKPMVTPPLATVPLASPTDTGLRTTDTMAAWNDPPMLKAKKVRHSFPDLF